MKFSTTKDHFILTKHPHRVAIQRDCDRMKAHHKEILKVKLYETERLRNSEVKHRCHNIGGDK